MTSTYAIVLFGENALLTKDDISAVQIMQGGLASFANTDHLKTESVSTKFATYEPNFWLLDGTYKFASASSYVGYMSAVVSGSGSPFNFSGPVPELRILFNTPHSTKSITLIGNEITGDWVDSLVIGFYDASNTLLNSAAYSPNKAVYTIPITVTDFKRIDLFFNSTNKPSRFARLVGIDFDEVVRFSNTEIKEAYAFEEINLLSTELPFNTLELTLFSENEDFSVIAPSGFYAGLEEKQPLDVYEIVDWKTHYIGRFYLDKWESESETVAKFQASDAIGLLDKPTVLFEGWNNGLLPEDGGGIQASVIIQQVFDDVEANIQFELDPSLTTKIVKGWFPVTSARKTLQQIAFSIGAYITCTRSNRIRILPMEKIGSISTTDYIITKDQKALNSPVSLKPFITKIELISHNYVYDNGEGPNVGRVFFDGNVAVGRHLILFDVLSQVKEFTGTATWTVHVDFYFNINYVIVDVTVAGTLKISHLAGFYHTTNSHSISSSASVPVNNTIRVETVYSIVPSYASEAMERMFYYYAQRHLQKTKLFGHPIKVGDSVVIDTQSDKKIKGIVERLKIDLAKGFVSEVDIVGVVLPDDITAYFDAGKYNSNHSKIIYTGSWSSAADGGAYSGDLQYVGDMLDGQATFGFIGIKFKLIYRRSATEGWINIYIDGKFIETLAQNGPAGNQIEWDSGYLSGIYHTVNITRASIYGVVNIDAVEII